MVKIEESWEKALAEEFGKAISNSSVNGKIEEGDVVIFINFRNDRAKELTQVLTQQDMPEEGMKTIPNLKYYCMTPYDASFKGVGPLKPRNMLTLHSSSMAVARLHSMVRIACS